MNVKLAGNILIGTYIVATATISAVMIVKSRKLSKQPVVKENTK